MSKLCDECETVAHCMKHGCIPKQQALDKKAENARKLGLDYEPVCNKDPQGCWNVRCQLGKKCKNAPAQQEPVGEVGEIDIDEDGQAFAWLALHKNVDIGDALYTSPPAQRTWVGLTDEEIAQGNKESWVTEQAWQSAVWWAEAKLKDKNT